MLRTAEETAALEAHIQATDPARWSRILETRERSARMVAERDAAEAQRALRWAKLEGFLSTLTPMTAGRARKSLERTMRWRTVYATRFEMIERLVLDGATLEGAKLMKTDGSYYDQEALTSFGLAYAAHLAA